MLVRGIPYYSSRQYPRGGGEAFAGLQSIESLRKFPISLFPNDSYFTPILKLTAS